MPKLPVILLFGLLLLGIPHIIWATSSSNSQRLFKNIRLSRRVLTASPTLGSTTQFSPPATPIPSSTPTPVETDVQKYIMQKINDYRQANGLSLVETDSYTCHFAQHKQKEYLSACFQHVLGN